MKNLLEIISQLKQELAILLPKAITKDSLEALRVAFLGRKGKIADLMDRLKILPLEEKKVIGPMLNQLKTEITEKIETQQTIIEQKQIAEHDAFEKNFDVTAYRYSELKGTSHLYTQIIADLENIFISMGYSIADGPEVENEFYNFESLNIPEDHPAREEDDSFFLEKKGWLLRTQASSVQARIMQHSTPPIAILSPGRCYRREATDQTHDFLFTQAEILVVDKNLSVSNLLATAHTFLRALFENDALEIRVRPGFFPFVEPGLEIDASCPFCINGCSICKHTRWIELLGTGMVHPNVLHTSGIDPSLYSGFAFGMGIERIAMIKYGIRDIRLFHASKIKFLDQFS